MTPAMIAALEQRLNRIAALSAIPRSARTIEEWGTLAYLANIVRRDAATYGGEFRRNR
jgi:hypothetical protein